ncbi:hypothetical protein B0T25DRAFT_455306 [Lasiosphaeria hispida]|uniref:Heterokaryon incompatibility domain-containing protein n=1 Tax=Lasiosphaeria hispida TaxID=260671 RepID=A0AAJ0HIT6_9PEZI|nr:hypothetical protein B0T25DRAFT_455306 [Lasiosphaeria hispida]
MDIFLARVCKDDNGMPYVEKKSSTTISEPYVAISHVWGDPETIREIHIETIGAVRLSPGKLDLLSLLRRPEVCGTNWFWLDLFCLDQPPSVAQLMSIPAIYKSATEVVILVESPVCTIWASKAAEIVASPEGVADMAVFDEEEARHARRCPHLLAMDPWFQRLWTRQEGLYAMRDRWLAEGRASAARDAANTFVVDKLAYHGLDSRDRTLVARFYLALAYTGKVSVAEAPFKSRVGPAANYSPIGEAWRSGRTTAKPRDYVLAVFPDVEGYIAPQNAKHATFEALLRDACEQVGRAGPQRGFHVLTKVAESMLTGSAGEEEWERPWILDKPRNITEAYDSILGVVSSRDISHGVQWSVDGLRGLELDCSASRIRSTIDSLVRLCDMGADLTQQMLLAAPLGPCLGSNRTLRSQEDMFHRYVAHQFSVPAVQHYLKSTPGARTKSWEHLQPHGVVNLDKIALSKSKLENELWRFLVCLMCGTTLRCADEILKHVSLAVVTSNCISGGEILAVVNKRVLDAPGRHRLVLGSNGFEDFQGLVLLSSTSSGKFAVGRTMAPRL